MKDRYDSQVGITDARFKAGDVVKLLNQNKTKFKFKYQGPFYIAEERPNGTYFLQRPDGRRWTTSNGTDIPINPDHLAPFMAFDGDFYYDGLHSVTQSQ